MITQKWAQLRLMTWLLVTNHENCWLDTWIFRHARTVGAHPAWRSKLAVMPSPIRRPRDPFLYDVGSHQNSETEFGFGRGRFANPELDYSAGGAKSGIPLADPDRTEQIRKLAEIRRLDNMDPNATPSPYVEGNTDRFGAQPPLVRERKQPEASPRPRYTHPRMERQW